MSPSETMPTRRLYHSDQAVVIADGQNANIDFSHYAGRVTNGLARVGDTHIGRHRFLALECG
jgi:hypothetical protein